MAEYIERSVGASILRAKANMAVLTGAAPYFEKAAQMLEKLPAADVAQVVRCKDCAHLYGTFCTVCGLLPRKPDDFCSCGERKDGTDSDTDGSI